MKLSKIFNLKNILSFIEGNYQFYYNQLVGLPPHITEQVMWRMMKCKDDCIPNESCKECGCDPKKKMFVKESCNEGERFPDLLDKEEWEEYKHTHKIVIE